MVNKRTHAHTRSRGSVIMRLHAQAEIAHASATPIWVQPHNECAANSRHVHDDGDRGDHGDSDDDDDDVIVRCLRCETHTHARRMSVSIIAHTTADSIHGTRENWSASSTAPPPLPPRLQPAQFDAVKFLISQMASWAPSNHMARMICTHSYTHTLTSVCDTRCTHIIDT